MSEPTLGERQDQGQDKPHTRRQTGNGRTYRIVMPESMRQRIALEIQELKRASRRIEETRRRIARR